MSFIFSIVICCFSFLSLIFKFHFQKKNLIFKRRIFQPFLRKETMKTKYHYLNTLTLYVNTKFYPFSILPLVVKYIPLISSGISCPKHIFLENDGCFKFLFQYDLTLNSKNFFLK